MRFTVSWTKEAEDTLTDLWLEAADRDAVKQASDTIDRLLASNPLGVGESRPVNFRILFEAPLGVVYDVRELDRHVKVWSVWRTRS